MGQNLIMNAADHGFKVIAFNRTVAKVDRFLENEAKGEREPTYEAVQTIDYGQENLLKEPTPSRNSFPSSRRPAASCC